MKEPRKWELEWGGKKLKIETGKLALQATSSVTVQYGDTVLLATVVISDKEREGATFFPLLVDYEEKMYAAGRIKSSRFLKREGRPSDEAVLTARLVDRALRPLFPEKLRRDVQVILTVLSIDQENDPDVPSLIAASVALSISKIPWDGPIGCIRIGQIEGEWAINPTYAAREKSKLDLVVAGTIEKVLMLEAGSQEVWEDVILEAIKFGQKRLKPVLDLIASIQKEVGEQKEQRREGSLDPSAEEEVVSETELNKMVVQFCESKKDEYIFRTPKATKSERKHIVDQLKEELDKYLEEKQIGKDKRKKLPDLVDPWVEEVVARAIIDEEKRVDGRKLDEIRPLNIEVAVLPRTHGSALFDRGETQVLSIVTLGSPGEEQVLETMEERGKKRYMHHYNFPPYSVGEVSPLRSPGRREIGHGALAERALVPLLPPKEEFPYTIRVVSEVLGSNGSSSMASICGSSLALMDAGVPIKKHVAGVAIGLASDASGKWKVITDLQDLEDGKGGMDFKIAGTSDGITSIQMDTKTAGLTFEILEQTLTQAKKARLEILEAMEKVIAAPRPELSPYAPRVYSLRVDPSKIRLVIGPQGKTINEIIEKTGVSIDVEQDGLVFVTALSKEMGDKAIEWIKSITREAKVGEVFDGKVTRIMDFGAFVEILPNTEGLVHISNLANYRVRSVEDVVKIGDPVRVQVTEIDDQGRVNLCLEGVECQPRTERPRRGANDRGRGDSQKRRRF